MASVPVQPFREGILSSPAFLLYQYLSPQWIRGCTLTVERAVFIQPAKPNADLLQKHTHRHTQRQWLAKNSDFLWPGQITHLPCVQYNRVSRGRPKYFLNTIMKFLHNKDTATKCHIQPFFVIKKETQILLSTYLSSFLSEHPRNLENAQRLVSQKNHYNTKYLKLKSL